MSVHKTESDNVMAILQWNCRGLFAHLEELKQHLAGTVKYDVICLQETLLKPNRRFNLPGFNIVRKDRATSSGGGGVLTLIRDGLNFVQVPCLFDI